MAMEEMKYAYELFESLPQQGPGDDGSTRRAFNAMSNPPKEPTALDIGCGSGRSTIALAKISKGHIIALDNYQGFLDVLNKKAEKEGLKGSITSQKGSMLEMDFASNSFDIIWSEGALYFMGFQNGLKRCRELLKDNGYLAVTELVYTTPNPPEAVRRYLENEYPDIKDVKERITLIQKEGYHLLSNFTLPELSWDENYYLPMQKELSRLIKKYQGNEEALNVFEAFQNEADFHKQYSKYYGYEFFVMQK